MIFSLDNIYLETSWFSDIYFLNIQMLLGTSYVECIIWPNYIVSKRGRTRVCLFSFVFTTFHMKVAWFGINSITVEYFDVIR